MKRPDKKKIVTLKLLRLGVKEQDLFESFIRSSAPGGQNVNKTSTCVYLKHLPTGIEVKCQRERSQALNRLLARQILLKKIEESTLKNIREERARLEKLRRQNRKRSKAAKLRILERKRRHAEKKRLRAKTWEME